MRNLDHSRLKNSCVPLRSKPIGTGGAAIARLAANLDTQISVRTCATGSRRLTQGCCCRSHMPSLQLETSVHYGPRAEAELDRMKMNREVWNRAECDLMVELCRYHAQTLFAYSTNFDPQDLSRNPQALTDGFVAAGTILSNQAITAFEMAMSALLECGFATSVEYPYFSCKLLVSSDEFELQTPPELPFSNQSSLGNAFSAMFKAYNHYGRLGHPETLKCVFGLLPAAGFLEERSGAAEWSAKAYSLARRPQPSELPWTKDDFFWKVDTFDWLVAEAARHWMQS